MTPNYTDLDLVTNLNMELKMFVEKGLKTILNTV